MVIFVEWFHQKRHVFLLCLTPDDFTRQEESTGTQYRLSCSLNDSVKCPRNMCSRNAFKITLIIKFLNKFKKNNVNDEKQH